VTEDQEDKSTERKKNKKYESKRRQTPSDAASEPDNLIDINDL
jgi:hypothetical protein